jgi:phosphohistidine swiveling domain-containing protein
MFKSKADTLNYLANKIKFGKIPKTYNFNIDQWNTNPNQILLNIRKIFKKKIAVRSSSYDEDTIKTSNAGKYKTFLNVKSSNKLQVKKKIISVIKSYTKNNNSKSTVVIQEMIGNINCSGVVFNRDMKTGMKYYVINYDDVSKRTDTVTSGNSENSNRVLFVYRNKLSDIKSKRFYKLAKVIKELELIFKDIPLDIEFIINKKLEIYILQVRPLIIKKTISNINQKKLDLILENFRKKFISINKNWKSVYGQMPDWNPVEIIGKHPRPLSYFLYKNLVLDNSWIKARKMMGYSYFFQNKQLMTSYLGQPFIDVKKSLISFIPKKTSRMLKNKLVNLYLKKLILKPDLHDKVEFEISVNCFLFDFKKRINELSFKSLFKNEINELNRDYKEIFLKNLQTTSLGSIELNIKKIEYLNKELETDNIKKFKLQFLADKVKTYGIVPFSILARHAFISENLLRSLNRMKILTQLDIDNFKQSNETITSKFIESCAQLSNKLISFKDFKKVYGHLRPGTYDITSKNYSSFKKSFFVSKNIYKKRKIFNLSKNKKKKIDELLKKNNIPMKSDNFFQYMKNSIQSREYSKFIFTKKINLILEKIKLIGDKYNLSKNQLSYLSLKDILRLENKKISYKKIKEKLYKNKKKYELFLNFKLPILIKNPKDIFVIPYQVSSPNFVTNKKVLSKVLIFVKNQQIESKIFKKRIIVIESADPGFDWIFNFKIKGLITRFGGANSHMSIRCNELGIPAVIGVGDKIYYDLKPSSVVWIDCKLKNISIH